MPLTVPARFLVVVALASVAAAVPAAQDTVVLDIYPESTALTYDDFDGTIITFRCENVPRDAFAVGFYARLTTKDWIYTHRGLWCFSSAEQEIWQEVMDDYARDMAENLESLTIRLAPEARLEYDLCEPGKDEKTWHGRMDNQSCDTATTSADPIVPGLTPVRAVHFTELRTRIDAVRGTAGLGRFPWTDPILTARVTPVRLVHLLELREALAAVYAATGRAAPRWTDAAPVAGTTPIRAAHLLELRAAVTALE